MRSPLDRIGYGGYLSLAVEHPDFIDRVEQIVAEFRSIHERSAGLRPLTPGFKVAVINSWGRLRSWMTHMVAHALWYRQTYTYLGVLEALSGLPAPTPPTGSPSSSPTSWAWTGRSAGA